MLTLRVNFLMMSSWRFANEEKWIRFAIHRAKEELNKNKAWKEASGIPGMT